MHDLLGLVCLVVGATAAFVLHARIVRRAGHRRLGRAAANLVAGICYGTALGATLFLVYDGWVPERFGPGRYHTTLPESVVLGAVVGALMGFGWFVMGERRREWSAFPSQDVAIVLADEAHTSRRTRAATARRLERRARQSGQPLPPELAAYVERNRPRGARG